MKHTIFVPLSFLIYNVLPYMTLIYWHYVNFKPEAEQMPMRRSSTINDTESRNLDEDDLNNHLQTRISKSNRDVFKRSFDISASESIVAMNLISVTDSARN